MAPGFETIEVGRAGQRGWVNLNRPAKLNPLSIQTLTELVRAAAWFDAAHEVKVVVFSGRGRAFSAGADLGGFGAHDPSGTGPGTGGTIAMRQGADTGRRMCDAVESMRPVTVARLHGHCVGGAVLLAAACDLRVAAADTRFSIPELALGIPLTWGGIPRLVREIGPALTKELVMTCRPFGAAEAAAAGFVNRVVAAEDLDGAVDDLVAELTAQSALTLEATKAHVNAVTAGMIAPARAWNDADSFVAALLDPESRAVAQAYLDRVRRT